MYQELFAKRLTELCSSKNMTFKEFEKLTGFSHYLTSNWISGKSSPNVSQVFKICQVLECTSKSLLGI